MRIRGIATGIAVLICLSACTSDSDPSPPKPTVATIDPAKAQVLKLGDDLEIVAELPRKVGASNAYFRSFTPDGKVLGIISLPEKPSGRMGGVETQSHPVLYDPETEKATILDGRDRKAPTQIIGINGNDDAVVWAETPQASVGITTFTIYSYDRRTKAIAQLATADDPEGHIAYGDDLVLAGRMAYFSRGSWAPKYSKDTAVYAVPVDGSTPAKVLVKGGGLVSIDDGVMKYATAKDTWVNRDLSTGDTTPVPTSPEADDPGFCGAEFTKSFETLCMGKPSGDETETVTGAKLTIKETSGRTTVFKPFPSDSPSNPTPHDVKAVGPWVGVTMTSDGGADRMFLIDLESHAMKAFPNDTGFGEMNHDGTQVLIVKTDDTKTWPQLIVRIPPKD